MKTVFYFNEVGIRAYSDHARLEESKETFFLWDDEVSLEKYLVTIPERSQTYLILDMVDEDIHFEWVPKVHSWEKKSILNRRKERFKNEDQVLSEVRWTSNVRKNEDGRNEEMILLATVHQNQNLTRFLATLEEAQVILTAIYSKAFLLAEFFKDKIRPALNLARSDLQKPFLLIARQSTTTFRQLFFLNGELRISRLVELEPLQQDAVYIQQALLDETKLAVKYIYSQNILPFNSPIGLVFLDGQAEVLVNLQANCQKEGLVRTTWEAGDFIFAASRFVDLIPDGQFCRTIMGTPSVDCFSQQAVVEYVFAQPPKGFYFNDYVLKISGLLQARKGVIALNVLLLLGSMYYILTNSVDALMSVHKQKLMSQYISAYEVEKTYLQDKVKLQDDAQEIKASVEFSEAILQLNVHGLLGFDAYDLSQIVSQHPNIQISKLEWKTLGQFDSQRNQLVLQGWVFPFYDTYLWPVTWVDNFVADLARLKGIEVVELQKEPLNRELSQSLTVDTKVGEVKALPFLVTLRVKDAQSN